MSETNIKYAVRNKLYVDCPVSWEQIKDLKLKTYYTCAMGRMKAFSRNKQKDPRRYQPMESIGVDYKGPISTRTVHQNRGFYLLSDHRTNAVWSYPCRLKGEDTLFKILEHFFSLALKYQDYSIKILRCDDDTVENSELITNVGQGSHTAHRWRRPRKFLDYAIHMAVYLIMRTPNAKNAKTPLEILTGAAPTTRNLIPFFCPGMHHVTRAERRSTFDPKAMPSRFLGYEENSGSATRSTQRILDRKD
eukprot:gene24601-biopygen21269